MEGWQKFFDAVDEMHATDPQRAELMELLHRNFAARYPGAWEGFDLAPRELRERIKTEWLAWALRDVEWIVSRAA